jgi:hypothetical protein
MQNLLNVTGFRGRRNEEENREQEFEMASAYRKLISSLDLGNPYFGGSCIYSPSEFLAKLVISTSLQNHPRLWKRIVKL